MIKAIIFDCFGVLSVDLWRAFCDSLDPSVDIESVRDLNRAFDKGFITKQQYLDGVEVVAGKRPPDIDVAYIQDTKNTLLLDYIRTLKPAYKTAILSNISNDWINQRLLNAEEQALFDAQILSYQVGAVKPDPLMYRMACDKLGVTPVQAVMVDDIERNISAAQELGMKGIFYQDFNQLKRELSRVLDSNS